MEPFGDDQRPIAQLSALTANINRKKTSQPLKAVDFLPLSKHKRDETDTATFLAQMKLMAARSKLAEIKQSGHHNRKPASPA